MEAFVHRIIETSGVPETSIILLLMLPIVATIVSFARHFIGIKSFGIYSPIILTFAYYQLGLQSQTYDRSNFLIGLKYGLPITIIILFATYVTLKITRKIHLHYLPKISIVITVASFAVIGTLIFGGLVKRLGFISVDIFALLVISTTAENFINAYNKKNLQFAIRLSTESIALAIVSFFIISIRTFQDTMIANPWIILISLLLNLIIGKWAGLRLTEYLRFYKILDQHEPAEDVEKQA